MTDEPARRYNDQEFALILRHAYGLQDRASPLPDTEGLTLEEITAAAREVGLDPDVVARAAALVPRHDSTRRSLLGGPERMQLEYTARGEILEADGAEIVDVIRRVTENQGKLVHAFGGFEWKAEGWITQLSVTVTPRKGETHIRMLADRGGPALLTFVGLTGAGLVGFGIAGAVLEPSSGAAIAGLLAATVGAGFLTARTVFARGSRQFRRFLTRLMTDVSAAVDRHIEDRPE